MKKSINIGVILFLLLQACSSSENTENQATIEPISEDTPINEPSEPNNPPPPEGNNPPPPPEEIILHLHQRVIILHLQKVEMI